ncbi:uncharacterized protein LOC124919546 [Impatiens glandulifera]|uniref:uncharacterized protein LOC124919546 n=1 Tax=Impatiens glandulifera TaxID=253017 RepID=UPI001FB1344C|nr:uncharacterized protein LOC124919546 [Impatiens glandulifera]XP_047315763.1 uncharacterized protein LOC124919546 [Impatiens glandulifera]XP_047315764.1 uncharacterized protein LOC124919546 [Impatiens glandulifera]
MAKKSQRRNGRYDKAQTGCIWTFISIFDFRNGRSTRRLLSDRRNSRRHAVGTEDFKTKQQMSRNSTGELQKCEEIEVVKLDLGKVSVKELMEKEMVSDTNGRYVRRNHKRWSSYGSKSDIEVLEDLANGQSRGLDLETIINDLCRQIRRERVVRLKPEDDIDDDLDNTRSDEKLDEAIQMFVIQKLTNENDLTVEGRTDVVRALRSNKDAIIKHLKEQNSPSNPNQHKILRRSQSLEEILLKEDYGYPSSDRIVILKSGISGIQSSTAKSNSSLEKKQTVATHFSFTEIKRRLMNAMTRDRSGQTALPSDNTTKQGNVEKNSVWNSPIKNRDYNEKYAMPSRGTRKKEKSETISDIYIEARKHLSEIILGSGGEIENCSSSRRSPRSLARILSLPEFNFSPIASPRKDTRPVSEAKEKNPLVFDNFQENLENQSYNGDEISKETEPFANTQVLDEISQSSGKGGDMEVVITDASVESELCLQVGTMELDDLEEEELLPSSPLSSSPTSPITKNKEHNERTERPSPVSVLDPTFGEEDDISPSSLKSNPGISAVQPQLIKFEDSSPQEICIGTNLEDEESAFEFVEAILFASDLKWDDFLDRWISCDPVLDPLLIHEVESFSSRSLHDQKLLFDGTNEVLEEVCQRYFGLSPRVSYLKSNIRPVPKGQDLIQEIWEGVELNLLQPSPFVLESTVKRDMAEKWIDLRLDTEDICFELCEEIFEQLLEETILS